MRKHMLFLAALMGLAGTTAHAQTERGSTLIGLTAGRPSFGRGDGFRHLSGTLTTSAGRFVADNLLVGVGVQVGHGRSESNFTGYYYNLNTQLTDYGSFAYQYRSWSVGVAPYARYYLLGRGRHRVFAEASVGAQRTWALARIQDAQGRLSNPHRFTSLSTRAALGYSYFLSPRTALEASAGVQRTYTSTGAATTFDGRIGVSFFLPAGKR